MSQATLDITDSVTSRERVSVLAASSPQSCFSLRKPFEELALFWQFQNGEPFRTGHVDGEFEVSFDRDGDWYVSDLWISVDNGKMGEACKAALVNLNADTHETFYTLILDNLSAQYTTRIEEWIEDELMDERPWPPLRRVA